MVKVEIYGIMDEKWFSRALPPSVGEHKNA